jgi:hypothetical protein
VEIVNACSESETYMLDLRPKFCALIHWIFPFPAKEEGGCKLGDIMRNGLQSGGHESFLRDTGSVLISLLHK